MLAIADWPAAGWATPAAAAAPSVFAEDVARYTRRLHNPQPERRIEGVQGLSYLKYWPAETAVIQLLADPSPAVRRAVVRALGRLGTARSVPQLIRVLTSSSWDLRQLAWLELRRMTAARFPADQPGQWQDWWRAGAATNHEAVLWAAVTNTPANPVMNRLDALRALPVFATPRSEAVLARLLWLPDLSVREREYLVAALERVGTPKAIPALAPLKVDAAAWALGRIGGPQAEQALRAFPPTLPVLINLDRLHSTNAGPFIPALVGQMGLITYRSQPDDLMNPEPQPIQRVAANLIRRSGRAAELIDQVLLELEYSMARPPAKPRPSRPAEWKTMLERMRSELKPGFVREDGMTTSQPVTAMYFLADDPALVPRLMPLLRHPAFVPRIYVALTLAKLRATNALPAMLELIREGYPFSDATALASGKHFDKSQTVRWRGFLCMALGRMGGASARRALERFAVDPAQPRDIRYGSVVGLRFIGAPASLPVLRRIAKNDIIWMIRHEAKESMAEIELLRAEGGR